MDKNELITAVTVPSLNGRKSAYMKVTSRSADDWPALGVAVSFKLQDGAIHDPVIVVSAATEKVTRMTSTEKVLQGAAPDDAALRRAGEAAVAEVSILADAHGSAAYKRELLRVYIATRGAPGFGRRHAAGAGMNQVGRDIPRLEVRAKVTGRADYTHNLRLPGMLYGKVFRATVPHGRIRSIDTQAARELPGVHRVITGEDIRKLIPEPYYGPAFHDQPILALDKVRYVGEPVAAVLASDPHVAEQAVQLISAEYDELPAVYDEVAAMQPDTLVHDVLRPAGTFADLKHLQGRKDTNVALDYHLRRGDADQGFAVAHRVIEHTFKTQQCLHLPFESHVAIAEPGDDRLTIYTSNQTPSFVRIEIARLFGWPENHVRVKVPYLGGGYGSKVYVKLEALVAALAMLVRRPVKIALTMEEQFYMITKHPTTFRIKSGVDKAGRVVARSCQVYWNGGAYADIGPRVTQKSGFTAAGPYDIDNVSIDSYALYTNRTPAGALRGFGVPQLVWAYESHTDLIARELGIDPVEFRRKNHSAQWPAAGERHGNARRRHRRCARCAGRPRRLE